MEAEGCKMVGANQVDDGFSDSTLSGTWYFVYLSFLLLFFLLLFLYKESRRGGGRGGGEERERRERETRVVVVERCSTPRLFWKKKRGRAKDGGWRRRAKEG